jgi:hypothetical protein
MSQNPREPQDLPDRSEIQRHEADLVQIRAELKRLDADARKDAARRQLDDELGLSTKRSQFKTRLEGLGKGAKDQLRSLMAQYKSDWEGFKADTATRFAKADRVGDSSMSLLEAHIDGLNARIQYLFGLAMQQNAKSAGVINDSLETVQNGFRKLCDEARAALGDRQAESSERLASYDEQLNTYIAKAERDLLERTKGGPEQTRH